MPTERKTPKVRDLVKTLTLARKHYYNHTPIMSDVAYDKMEDKLRKIDPTNPFFKKVGALPTSRKVKLPYPMGSLSKVKGDGSARRWLKEAKYPVTVSDKEDGASALVDMTKSDTMRFYSRGNGTIGQDISPLLEHIQGIGKLPKNFAIRGEVLMPHKAFKGKLASEFSNPRNLASGILNSKSIHAAASKTVFIVHSIVRPRQTIASSASKLKALGWKVVPHEVFRSGLTEEVLRKYLDMRRRKSKFLMDGLVLTDANGNSMAFKGQDEAATAVVSKVVWRLSRYGLFKPVVHFKKALQLDGVSVTKATGHNARFIMDNGIGKGAIVEIVRSNGVIPKVVSVVKKSSLVKPPKEAHSWDANKVEFITLSEDSDGMKASQMSSFLTILGVEGTKGGLLSRVVDSGIDTIPKLLKASVKKLEAAGLGPKQATTLFTSLKDAVSKVTHSDLMAASNCFPRGWGRRRLKALLKEFSYAKLVSMSQGDRVDAISNTAGFSIILATQFDAGLSKYKKFLSETGISPGLSVTVVKKKSSKLEGTEVVFTGVRDKEVEAAIEENGGRVASSVSKNTRILVVKDTNSSSVKMQKARQLGVKIIDINAARKMFLKQ